jgi:CDP-2,3-bis-(O-geranylgeranyl)-sn-glycerol synthase
MWLLAVILHALYYLSPAYAANSIPVLFGGGTPIDFGRKFRDGKRIFGDGKTWRGFFFGLIAAFLMGLLWFYLSQNGPLSETYYGISFRMPDPLFGIYLGFGALLGDLVKSFFKRRLGFKRGQAFWIADQLDFVVGALIFAYIFAPNFITWPEILVLLLVSPAMHLIANLIAYKCHRKKEWW